jgi:hypothetical protein
MSTTEWEKVSANHVSDKGLLYKIYTELLKLNSKNKIQFKNGQSKPGASGSCL